MSRPALFLVAATLLAASFLAGCGAQARVIPSAIDTQAIDVAAAGSPAQLPSRTSGVPAGQILEMTQWIARSDGRELHSRRWVDFEKRRARWDTYGDVASILGGSTTTAIDPAVATILFSSVVDDTREISYDAASAELRSQPVSGEDAFAGLEDSSTHDDVVKLGRQSLNGTRVDVYRVDLNIPRGQERSADFGLIYADSTTGLRVREEWLLGSPGHAWVYHLLEYQLVPRTPELENRMRPEALIAQAAQELAGHMAKVAKLDFPVWGLPPGAGGLVLTGATILVRDEGTLVQLAYGRAGSIGPAAVTIETWDLRHRVGYPAGLLGTREDAIANSGGTDRIGFRMSAGGSGGPGTDGAATTVSVPGEVEGGETAVQILLGSQAAELPEAPSLGALAAELVDVRGQ